jgi:hypothetical protein
MSRLRLADQVRALKHRHDQLLLEFESELRSRRGLQLRHSLAAALCEALSFMQVRLAGQGLDATLEGDADVLERLLQQEVTLLQELNGSALEATGPQPVLQELLQQQDVQSLAPCTDPMAYLRRVMSSSLPEAATMTPEDVADMMGKAVVNISMQLHHLDCLQPWDQPPLLQKMADIWDRCVGLLQLA